MAKALVDILDDDPRNQKLLRLLVERAGCEARTHAGAATALAAMRADPPAVALIDVQLPGPMDGLAVVRALKAVPETAGIIVVVVSAFASIADEARAREAGCDLWMPKPVDVREFLACMARLTGSAADRTAGDDES